MRERMLALHGSLSLERPEHGGLRVRAELPLPDRLSAAANTRTCT